MTEAVSDRHEAKSIIDRHLAGEAFESIIAEIKNADPAKLVASNALSKAIEDKNRLHKQFAEELLVLGDNTHTGKIDLANSIQIVMAIAAKVPQKERQAHISDGDVAVIDRIHRELMLKNSIATNSATMLSSGKAIG